LLSPLTRILGAKRPALPMNTSGDQPEIRPAWPDIIDVPVIGSEAAVLRPVQRALVASGWIIRHADTVYSACRLLETTKVAAAVLEVDKEWVDSLF
jgi:hypothetical protein